jgi:hypothetical protein
MPRLTLSAMDKFFGQVHPPDLNPWVHLSGSGIEIMYAIFVTPPVSIDPGTLEALFDWPVPHDTRSVPGVLSV